MDKTQLETFLTIVEQKSYSKTATLLNVTQPTVTARIKNLELELSCSLFERVGRMIVPTKEGTVFFEYATNILTYMNHSKEVTKHSNFPEIRIGFSPGYSYSFMTELLNAIITIENLNITIIEGEDSCSLNEQILSGELDLVFTRNVSAHRPEILTEYLFDNNLVVVLGKDHHLAEKDELAIGDLEGETLISYKRKSNLWNEIDQKLVGVPDIKRIDVDNNEMLVTIIESGIGIGITPSLGIHRLNKNDIIVKKIEDISNIPNRVYVQYRKSSIIAAPVKKIIYSIINHEMEVTCN